MIAMMDWEFNLLLLRKNKLAEEKLQNFSSFYLDFQHMVRRTLYRLCGQSQLDDLVQECFFKLWKGLPGFAEKSKLSTWVYQVTLNVAHDFWRKEKKPLDYQKPSALIYPEEERANRQWVQESLKELSSEHREVLVLHLMEELSQDEISEILKVPLGTVKSRLHYAKIKMEEVLKRNEVLI